MGDITTETRNDGIIIYKAVEVESNAIEDVRLVEMSERSLDRAVH